jgi:molybdate transport system substrate-binding protein
MQKLLRPRFVLAWIAVFASLLSMHLAAQQPPVRVLASNGFKAVLEQVRPQCERSIGRPLAIEYNSSTGLKQKMDAGQGFEVAIVTTELMDTLVKERKIAAGSTAALAKAGVGVGIRKGAAKPDIRTAESMKKTLMNVKSMTYAEDGASRTYVERMFQKMGIAEAMKAKTVLEQGSGRATARVADGKTEMVLTLSSEILPVAGIELVGGLPKEYQEYVGFSAGVGAGAANKDAAETVIKFLASAPVVAALKAKGMEKP